MVLNPDFRTVEDIDIPDDYNGGWRVPGAYDERDMVNVERRKIDSLEKDLPFNFRLQEQGPVASAIYDKWVEFQKSKGRYGDSCDWTLLDEFVLEGKTLDWLPQIIGSCVCSNTFRGWVIRMMYQVTFFTGEYLGREEFGYKNNYSFWCPYSYGDSRKRGNLRGGDGSFCGVMAESLVKSGVVTCNNPKVIEICRGYSALGDRDFPEPQNERLYRAIGNWQHLDTLSAETQYQLVESPPVRDLNTLMTLLKQGKPAFVCSMEAIHKIGDHPDGFPIHARNPRSQWAHNMAFHGFFYASDGELFIRQSNESWGKNHMYNRRATEVEQRLRSGQLTVQGIGQITGPVTPAPTI